MQVADGNGGTDTQAISVTVVDTNDDPIISSASAASVAEQQAEVLTVMSTDADGDVPSYSIGGGADAALFSIDETSGVLAFQTAPDFESPADSDSNNVYEVIVGVIDGNGGTDTQAITVSVTNVNEDPVITSAATVSVAEDQTTVLTVVSTDVDGGPPDYSITGGTDAALFDIDSVTGDLTFSSAPDFETPGDTDGNNIYDVIVEVADGNGGTDTQAISVSLANVNEGPIITSAETISIVENQTTVLTVTSADVDGDVPSYSIAGGPDAALFDIDSATGDLVFASAPDFENPIDFDSDNVYELIVQVIDGNGGVDTRSIEIIVTGLNEDPILTSAADISVVENENDILAVTSIDADGDTPSYSIIGGADSALFSIDSASGALSFNSDRNFENPGDLDNDNVYEVTVQVVDGQGGADLQTIAVAVTNANDAPVLGNGVAGTEGGSPAIQFSVDENSDSRIPVSAVDEDSDSVLSYALTGGADQSSFEIDSVTGEITFVTPPDHEAKDRFEVEVTVTDNGGLSSSSSVVIDVQDVNESPTALSDSLQANENEVLIIDAIASIIANDSDPEQDVLTLVEFSQPENGTLVLNAQGNLEYQPDVGFVGQDNFEYVVADAGGLQVSAQVWLDVRRVDIPDLSSALPAIDEFEEVATTQSEAEQSIQTDTDMDVIVDTDVEMTPVVGSSIEEPNSENPEEVLGEAAAAMLITDVFSSSNSSLITEQNTNSDQPPRSVQQSVEKISLVLNQVLDIQGSSMSIDFDALGYEQGISPELRGGILVLREQIDQLVNETSSTRPLTTLAPSVVGASLTAGIVTWVLRSGLLLSATLTSSPLWRPIDPVPILMQSDDEEDSLFEHGGEDDSDIQDVSHG